ncbi:hypothetical protein BJ166DRAFT_493292 [Pestalotiopsis sp. NC0098]|nr:hypothetical protein BJ166DRAFT_493292 [Pestalotiopsis sp. NC0098]
MYSPRLLSQSRGSYQARPHTYYESIGASTREQDNEFLDMLGDLHITDVPRRDERRVFSRPPPAYENSHNLPRDSRRLSDVYVGESIRPIPGTMASGGASPRVRQRSSEYGPSPVREYSDMREPYYHHQEELFVDPRYEPNPMRPRRQTVSDSWEYRRPTVREMPRRVSLRADFDHDQRRMSRDVSFHEEEVPISPVRPPVRNFSRPFVGEALTKQPTRTSQPVSPRVGDTQHSSRRKTFFLSDEEEEEPEQRPRVETPRRTSANPRPQSRAQAPEPERQIRRTSTDPRPQSRAQAPEPERQTRRTSTDPRPQSRAQVPEPEVQTRRQAPEPQEPKVGIYINTGNQESHGSGSSRSHRPSEKAPSSSSVEDKSSKSSRHRRHTHSHHAEEPRERRRTHGSHEEEPRRERDSRRKSSSTKETRERSSRHHTSDEPSRHKSRRKSSHASKERHASCHQQ